MKQILELLQKLSWSISWQGLMCTRVFLCSSCYLVFEPFIINDSFNLEWRAGGGFPGICHVMGDSKGHDKPADDYKCPCCGKPLNEDMNDGMGWEISMTFSVKPD